MIKSIKPFYLIPVLAVLYLCLAVPRLHNPELNHGDEYQDAMTMITGSNYLKFGFIRMRFLPLLDLQQDSPHDLYTHYPPLPFIINGFLRILFHSDSLAFFRLIALCFSFLTLVFWYLFVCHLSGSWKTGFPAALFYLANPFFIYGMDSISEFMYSDVVLMAVLYLFARMAYDPRRRTRGGYALIWLLLLVESFITFEYMVFLTLFFILFRYLMQAPQRFPSWKAVIFFTSAPIAGFMLHLLQNAWYFGGMGGAVNDLVSSASYRMSGKAESALNFPIWWNHVFLHHISMAFVLPLFLLAVCSFCSYLAYQRLSPGQKQRVRFMLRAFVILFVCGITWYVFFPSHSFVHAYVHFLVRHLVPAAAFGFTIVTMIFWYRSKGPGVIKKGVLCAAAAGVLITGVFHSGLPLTAVGAAQEKDFLVFRDCLYTLRQASAPGDVVGLNYHRYPFISYYTDRYCVRYHDKESLVNGTKVPRYFIFFPYGNPAAAELLGYLQEKYKAIYSCSSQRYPAVFFELNTP